MLKKLVIIESLRQSDRKLGKVLKKSYERKGLPVTYFKPKSIKELYDIFVKVERILDDDAFSPLAIQFICHGNKRGIGLTNGELVTWEDLRKSFRKIYIKTKHRFLLSMGSCKGFNVSKLIVKHKPCPFSALCGTSEVLTFQDLIEGFIVFYDAILANKSPEVAAASVDISIPTFKMLAYDTHRLWDVIANNFREQKLTDEGIDQLLNDALERHKTAIQQSPEIEEKIRHHYSRKSLLERLELWERDFKS